MNARAQRILTGLFAVLLAAACTRPESDGDPVVLSVRIGTATTRAASAAYDCDAINRLSVFVFQADGTLENSASSRGNSLSLALSKGSGKRLCVLANAPASVDSCTTESGLRSLRATLSGQLSGAFSMAWSERLDVDGDTDLTLEIPRIVAQIRLDRITNRSAHDLTLRALYLTNVPVAAAPWFSPDTYEPSAWAHPMGYTASEWDGWLLDDLGGRVLAPGASLEETHVFFSLPNPVARDVCSGAWTPRKTRLVVEAEMEGILYYYPFTFDKLLANHRYTLSNLSITRPGSRDPDIPVDPRDARISVSLLSWKGTVSYTDPI